MHKERSLKGIGQFPGLISPSIQTSLLHLLPSSKKKLTVFSTHYDDVNHIPPSQRNYAQNDTFMIIQTSYHIQLNQQIHTIRIKTQFQDK